MLAGVEEKPEIDMRAVHRFLTFTYLPGRETLIKDVIKVLPGERIAIQNGVIDRTQYWDLDFGAARFQGEFEEAVEELEDRFRRTVSDYLVSDVPVGVLLSGGLDSKRSS